MNSNGGLMLSLAIKAYGFKKTLASIGSDPVETITATPNSNNHDNDSEGKTVVKGEDSDSLVAGICNYFSVQTFVMTAIVSGILAFWWIETYLIDISSSILSLIIAPAVAIQRYKLQKLGGFRHQHNLLRATTNLFHTENVKLSNSISALQAENEKLKSVNQGLEQVQQRTGKSIEFLQSLLKRNATVQAQMVDNLQEQILSQIVDACLQADADHDFVVDPPEVDRLILRLQMLNGVSLDEAKFKAYLNSTANAGALTFDDFLDIARDLQTAANNVSLSKMTISSDKAFFTFHPREFLKAQKQ